VKLLYVYERARTFRAGSGRGGTPAYWIESLDAGLAMPGDFSLTPEIMRQYLAAHAPELEVVELPEAHTTEYISREWKVLPAQVAKTLTLRVGEGAIIVVTCGDSRLDNRKVKEELGGKGHMMLGSEASEITGHPVGAITPLCLASVLPVFFDIGLKRFEEVVTAGGSTQAAIRIPPDRFAQLVNAKWVDICKDA
jgi:prolyl-tRNA editing enzyme YbaK/EbsC (Cys-tRNA(Pro) deacylase)